MYLDHAATTPLRPEARDAWIAAGETVGNASSIHGAGQSARRLLEESRERLAAALECDPIEVVFTSGATESDALGVVAHGLGLSGYGKGKRPVDKSFILHKAAGVLLERLRREGYADEVAEKAAEKTAERLASQVVADRVADQVVERLAGRSEEVK